MTDVLFTTDNHVIDHVSSRFPGFDRTHSSTVNKLPLECMRLITEVPCKLLLQTSPRETITL